MTRDEQSVVTTVDPRPGGNIRQAVRADLLSVLRIEREVFEHPWDFQSFERFVDVPGFLVMDDPEPGGSIGGDVAGYVVSDVIEPGTRPVGHVKDLAVKPERQGEGRGRLLLQRSLSVLRSQGISEVHLEVRPSNDRALDLYRRQGFSFEGTKGNYYPDGENALLLSRSLDDRDRF
ncbi:MAG: GNAT family N-acetyltransferase [Halodesulfurarchaeum sp.]